MRAAVLAIALAGCAALPPAVPEATLAKGRVSSVFGHFRYDDAKRGDLVALCNVNYAPLVHKSAAPDVKRMIAAAQADGLNLSPDSCFRPITRQTDLFFGRIARGLDTPETRARLSAPPGFSEHHTGYAIDFCDNDDRRTCNFEADFATTKVGKWLAANAEKFNFEQSFTGANQCFTRSDGQRQCVAPEAWHFRWVGDDRARAVFAHARATRAPAP
jgi:zinc D-Ala-D-Ala carboxypeptidase